MALPFESAPATRLEKSGLARLGYQLSQQQKAEKQAERERYEGMLEEVSGSYWADRDGGILGQAGNALMEMAVNPDYFNAPLGSENHKKFIRAKKQYKDLAAMSALNQKQFMEQQKFLQQQGSDKVVGVDALRQYYAMGDAKGEVTVDESGNYLLNGEPMITSGIFSTPPSLSKKPERANLEDIWGGTKIEQFQSADGTYSIPSRDKAYTFLRDKFAGMGDKEKYLRTYITDAYVRQYGQQPADGYVESVIQNSGDAIYDAMLQDMTDIHLTQYKSGGKVSGSDGKPVDSWGVDRSNLSIKPAKGEGSYGFTTKEIRFVPETGDKSEMYFIDRVEFDDNGQMYVTGIKLRGDKNAAAMRAVEEGTAWEQIMSTYSMDSEFVKRQPLNTSDQEELLAAVSDKHKALNSLKTLEDFRGWAADYARYSPSSNKQNKQEEVEPSSGGVIPEPVGAFDEQSTEDVEDKQPPLPQGNVPLF